MSANEIEAIVWKMQSLKAPGSDVLAGTSYKSFWDIVGDDIIEFVQSLFLNTCLDKVFNHTFLTFIPKRIDALLTDHYRPISLCNFSYKIISDIQASRL